MLAHPCGLLAPKLLPSMLGPTVAVSTARSPGRLALGGGAAHVIAEVRNSEGHLVQLDEVAWKHALHRHVEMSGYLEETMAYPIVAAPSHPSVTTTLST